MRTDHFDITSMVSMMMFMGTMCDLMDVCDLVFVDVVFSAIRCKCTKLKDVMQEREQEE